MGEAKLRRATSAREYPSSEKFSRGIVGRGLVLSPPVEISGSSLFARTTNLDAQELRFATLFWDRLVWPASRAIHFASGPDEEFLEKAEILTRPEYTVWGDAAQGFVQQQINAFNDLEEREPGLWSLAQGKNSLLVKGGQLVDGNSAQLRLNRALIVPNEDVPLSEVLEFKARRNDELQAVRAEIDMFASAIDGAIDKERELEKNIIAIDRACADAIKVGKEWQFPVKLTDFKIDYKFRPLATIGGAITGVLGGQIALTATQTALAGVAGAAIATASILELSWKGFEWRGLKNRSSPYRYVYNFHRELF